MSSPMQHLGTKEYKGQIDRTGVSFQMWNILHEPSAQRRVRICYENYYNIITLSIKSKQPIFPYLCAVARTFSQEAMTFKEANLADLYPVSCQTQAFFLSSTGP